MTNLKYNLVRWGDQGNITVVYDGEMYTANEQHPNWTAIIAGVDKDDVKVVDLFDPSKTVAKKFKRLTDRITVSNGTLFFDGDPVSNALTTQVIRFIDEGVDNWRPLVNFFEKVQTNPNEHSREQLFRWLDKHAFSITPSGDIVGYKGVYRDDTYGYKSSSRGKATVNGEVFTGQIPNPLGAVVEMPRSEVQHDPSVGCHTGLHVGTYQYAKSFAPVLLEVHVNPRDVVSVPTDCADQKVRACRYTVVKEITAQYNTAVVISAEEWEDAADDWDEDSWDDGYGVYAVATPVSTVVDTRLNHLKQQRYPKGHPKAGQFIPKGVKP